MYAEHFRLRAEPFSIAPDPRYLFMSAQHREALAHLLYGIGGGGGFVLLTGEIGAGKTTVCRCFLEQIPAHCRVAYIFNPKLTVAELLQTVCEEFGIEAGAAADAGVKVRVDALNEFLLAAHARGEHAVLIIDEAQSLSAEVLEQLRLLTNLETSECKLLQIVLIGQPELRAMLGERGLEQLAQRVIARYHLGPLDAADTARYVGHRLAVAGSATLPFTPGAMARMHALSGGVPRRINLLADRALLGAYAQGRPQVDRSTLERAAVEVFGRSPPSWSWRGSGSRAGWAVAAVVGLLAVSGGLAAWAWLGPPRVGGPAIAGQAGGAVVAAGAPVPAAGAQAEASARPASPGAAVTGAVGDIAAAAASAASGVSGVSGPSTASAGGAGIAAALAAAPWREDEALRALAGRWRVALPEGEPCAAAARAGLACYRSRDGLAALQLLDRPALLMLRSPQGTAVPALLTALDERTATLQVAGAQHGLSRTQLAGLWRGEFTTLWRPPAEWRAGVDPIPEPVRVWLGQRLGAAGLGDEALPVRERVRAFQLAAGLEPDGVPGPLTLMLLARQGGNEREPRLRQTGGER